jgi:integrase
MRFEETALFRPHLDGRHDRVVIRRGTKGGASRFVMIRTMAQADALEAAKAATRGDRGLIPAEYPTFKSYADWVYAQLRSAGIGRVTGTTFHDLRRTYAVDRMSLLLLSGHCREAAAHVVSRELGHHRAEVLNWYVDSAFLDRFQTQRLA